MKELKRLRGMRRRKTARPRSVVPFPLVPASEPQREKVAGLRCLVCDKAPVDPAHIVPQRLGGCAHPLCVVGLCRSCHRAYDRNGFALGPHLQGACQRELEHAREHASEAALAAALAGQGWPR